MSALLMLLVLGVWGAALYFAAYYLTFFIQKKRTRVLIGATTTAILFLAPVWDEIKGRAEFEALCKSGGVYQIAPGAVGKKFDLRYSSTDSKPLAGFSRPVTEKTVSFADVTTGEIVASAKAYSAGGGWLVRSGGQNPLTGGSGPLIGRGQCFPGDEPEQARRVHAITNKIVN